MNVAQTSVLVVGAGPTGLTLATDLARRGVPVRVIDRATEFQTGSRGKGLQPRSLEVFDDLGVVDAIRAAGTSLTFRYYQRDQVLQEVNPHDGIEATPDVPYPRPLIIPQFSVEEILRTRLASLGVTVELGRELTSFNQTETGVTATVSGEEIHADYLIACDGGKSGIRKALGVDFVGDSSPEQMLLLGDVEIEGLADDVWHQWWGERNALLLCPLAGTRAWQFQATPEDPSDEPSLAKFQRIVDTRTGLPIRLSNPTWLSTYRVNVRVAAQLRVGRVFLAGDAAHVHSIAGGLGMNTGIQDAYNLGWKLAMVLLGEAEAGLLDTYQEERLPVAQWTLDHSSAGLAAASKAAQDGKGGLHTAISSDTRQLALNYRWSSLARDLTKRLDGVPAAGDRAPDAPVRLPDGSPARLFDVFRGGRFTLLGLGAGAEAAVRRLAGRHTWLATCLVADDKTATVVDDGGQVERAYGSDALVLVRPDGYVGATADQDDLAGILDYLDSLTKSPAR
jgi:2-polyprenyl-6-methoxyphenol hydroxylase-like FAD-dependent oxidoreductase